jgi:SAM-dependent methyltransferase
MAEGPAPEFDRYSGTYDATVDSSTSFIGLSVRHFAALKAVHILKELSRHFKEVKTVSLLDVGCGTGNLHPFLRDHVYMLSGVDISPACLEVARERNPSIDYRSYDGVRLPCSDRQFDVVIAVCVLHHITPSGRGSFVRELHRVTKKGGLGIVFEHNPYHPLTRRVVSSCAFDDGVILLTRAELERLFAASGFIGVASRYTLILPPVSNVIRRIDPLFCRLPLGAQFYTKGVVL